MGLDTSSLTSAERLSLSRLHAKHKEILGKSPGSCIFNLIYLVWNETDGKYNIRYKNDIK